MKKTFSMIVLCAALSACASTNGKKSECFGKTKADGTYSQVAEVTRNIRAKSFIAVADDVGGVDDCEFHDF